MIKDECDDKEHALQPVMDLPFEVSDSLSLESLGIAFFLAFSVNPYPML